MQECLCSQYKSCANLAPLAPIDYINNRSPRP